MLLSSVSSWSLIFTSVLSLGHGRLGDQARARQTMRSEMLTTLDRGVESADTSSFRYLNKYTEQYRVKSLPYVHYDVGELYSGSIPVYDSLNRSLFYVFQPTIGEPVDEILIWLNGGPGDSSLEGFLQENGRFVWQFGTFRPTLNPYSWVNLTNMMWVEYPVGVGFTTGVINATNEQDAAQDFIGFFKNFQEIFGIKNYKIYLSGESYAGRYVPYIGSAMLEQDDSEYFDISGLLIYDGTIGSYNYQSEIAAVPFVQANSNIFNFNRTFMDRLEQLHESCGYAQYLEDYLVYPARGVQPPQFLSYSQVGDCAVYEASYYGSFDANPCFDVYEITTTCPLLWDVLGVPTLIYSPPGWKPYFDHDDVKKAIHAPLDVHWTEYAHHHVFTGHGGPEAPETAHDESADPIQYVLPQVIEATNRVLIANGDYDMGILTNTTLLAIQNMTWNGILGFEEKPHKPINIRIPDLQYPKVFKDYGYGGYDGPQGIMGIQHFERGLMFAETYQCGHLGPQYQPRVAYRHVEWLLGRTDHI